MNALYALPSRKFLFLLLLLLSASALRAQEWSPVSNFPSAATDASFSFVIGDKAYLGAGLISADFYSYNSTTGEWARLGNLPGGRPHAWSFAFSYNGKGYLGGGDIGNAAPAADFYEYDPAANTWTAKASFGPGGRDGCFAFVLGDKAYVGAGFDGQYVWNDVWEYSFTNDRWTKLSNFPGGAVLFSSSFVLNGKGYVVGGGGQTESSALFEFDPVTMGWTRKADYPGTARQAGFAFAVNGLGYYGGGMAGYVRTFRDFWSYNPQTNKWSQLEEQYPDDYSAWGVNFVIEDKVYMGTGAAFVNQGIDFTNRFYAFNTDISSVDETLSAATELRLLPNPAADALNLSFTLSHAERVSVSILDLQGRRVGSMFEGFLPEGKHQQEIDLSTLQSGAYFVEIVTGKGVERRKFIKLP